MKRMDTQSNEPPRQDASPVPATTTLYVGPMPKGPKRCIQCGKEFKPGEAWQRLTAPDDRQFGTYSIGVHVRCSKR